MVMWLLFRFFIASSISGWLFKLAKLVKCTRCIIQPYASESENKDAKLFNCVQRGHQNSLELMPIFFLTMILGGMGHPCICAGLGLLYIVAGYFYFTGYSTGVPQKRLSIGRFGFLALIDLIICTISFGVKLLPG